MCFPAGFGSFGVIPTRDLLAKKEKKKKHIKTHTITPHPTPFSTPHKSNLYFSSENNSGSSPTILCAQPGQHITWFIYSLEYDNRMILFIYLLFIDSGWCVWGGPWSGERYDEHDGVWQLDLKSLVCWEKYRGSTFSSRDGYWFFFKISTSRNLPSLWNLYSYLTSKEFLIFPHPQFTPNAPSKPEYRKYRIELFEGIFFKFLQREFFHLKLTAWLEGNIPKIVTLCFKLELPSAQQYKNGWIRVFAQVKFEHLNRLPWEKFGISPWSCCIAAQLCGGGGGSGGEGGGGCE